MQSAQCPAAASGRCEPRGELQATRMGYPPRSSWRMWRMEVVKALVVRADYRCLGACRASRAGGARVDHAPDFALRFGYISSAAESPPAPFQRAKIMPAHPQGLATILGA